MATLEIKKQTGGYFRFILDGDSDNAIIDNAPNLTSFGNTLNFKTKNGANLIKKQFINFDEVTYIDEDDDSFTFGTIDALWLKLISEGFFDGLGTGGGGGGVDRFDNLLDTFDYTGNDGKVPVVNQSELKLDAVDFYNFDKFTQLSDVEIPSLIEGKILSVELVSGIPKIVLSDPPAETMQLANTVGFLDYNDLATNTTHLTLVANVDKKLENDTLGSFTNTLYSPFGVSSIWNSSTNSYDFTELTLGDTIDIRFDISVTTTSANQRVKGFLRIGEGTGSQYDLLFLDTQFKTAGTYQIVRTTGIYLGSDVYRLNPASFYVNTDSSGTCVVNGWYNRIIRVGVNVLDINIEEDILADHYKGLWDASTNTPTLSNGIGQVGDYYRVSVSGTQFSTNYVINDIIAFNGLTWYRKVNNNQTSGSIITRKTITSSSLSTQNITGFLTYVNGVTAFAIASNEHVIYEVTDTNQKFLIYPNGISVGSGQTALTSSQVAEIEQPRKTLLQALGGSSRFSLATTNNYPFLGVAINSGAVTAGYNFSPYITDKYISNYVLLTAGAAGSNKGYKYTANVQFTGLWEGLTFCCMIMPYTITDIISRFGFPHTGTFTANTENLNHGAWFNLINGNLTARTASGGAGNSGSTVAINNREWLILYIEVIANPQTGTGSQSILFKAKKLDGTIVYNESITTSIVYPGTASYQQIECGIISTKGTAAGNDGLLGIAHGEFWSQKPNHLINF